MVLVSPVAPRNVEILGRNDGEEVVVAEGGSLTLDCVVKDARPAPSANWLRDGAPLPPGECPSPCVATRRLAPAGIRWCSHALYSYIIVFWKEVVVVRSWRHPVSASFQPGEELDLPRPDGCLVAACTSSLTNSHEFENSGGGAATWPNLCHHYHCVSSIPSSWRDLRALSVTPTHTAANPPSWLSSSSSSLLFVMRPNNIHHGSDAKLVGSCVSHHRRFCVIWDVEKVNTRITLQVLCR